MPTPPRLLAALAALLASLACTHGASPTAPAAETPAAAPLSLTYLGLAGWRFDASGHTLLVDPCFTRIARADDSKRIGPDLAALARFAPARADAVLIEHSHWDHLLDGPELARRTGALFIGSESSANVARASGVAPDRIRAAQPGDRFDAGPFVIRVKRGLHSLNGQPDLPIAAGLPLPMRIADYAMGGTLHYLVTAGGHTVLFINSANFVESELAGERPDVLVVAPGLREKVPGYTCRLMKALGAPKLVLVNHFDDLDAPLAAGPVPMDEDDKKYFAAFADEVHACAPESRVIVPGHLEPIAL